MTWLNLYLSLMQKDGRHAVSTGIYQFQSNPALSGLPGDTSMTSGERYGQRLYFDHSRAPYGQGFIYAERDSIQLPSSY
jgi:hypothetical protein